MGSKKRELGPYYIVGSIVLIVVSCIATVIFSLDYPVYMDDAYLKPHSVVDKNYNEIQISQAKFNEKYSVILENNHFSNDVNLSISITQKETNQPFDIKSKVLITRSFTNKFDIKPKSKFENGVLKIEPLKLDQDGKWQLKVELSDDEYSGFFGFDFFVNYKND
ncbi:hypothetical protein F1B92_02810 [Campylobacter sp. FMV-PI01]|uniref:FixH family protein n=1 Tax=Campylobacter portucalensis TaxID=2608384 RepID=A0A6L5WJE1_9BACT|nr:hypothetical protein [Campylobacter portucalensis]MSN96135.1 hypothetical protein [Campylobacter portucalensis]